MYRPDLIDAYFPSSAEWLATMDAAIFEQGHHFNHYGKSRVGQLMHAICPALLQTINDLCSHPERAETICDRLRDGLLICLMTYCNYQQVTGKNIIPVTAEEAGATHAAWITPTATILTVVREAQGGDAAVSIAQTALDMVRAFNSN